MAAAGSAAFVASGSRATTAETPSPIVAENARPGTRDWLLTNVKVDDGKRSVAIEGYCSHTSIRAGETLSIFVSTRPVSRFTLQIYRTGFYGGHGARLMADLGGFVGTELIGAHSTGEVVRTSPWICSKPDHWIYAGTGMKQDDEIPGVIGWEFHGDPAPIPGLEIIATGPPGAKNAYTATVYPGPKDNIVFNAATCWWADGVAAPPDYVHPAGPKGPHPQLQRVTKNVLDRMLAAR